MGRVLDGLAASPGSAAGRIRLLGVATGGDAATVAADRRHDEERVALEAVDAAILDAAEAHAKVIGDLDDPRLAERADDIRSVGRRAARLLRSDPGSEGDPDGNGSAQILVAPDLGPADVAQ